MLLKTAISDVHLIANAFRWNCDPQQDKYPFMKFIARLMLAAFLAAFAASAVAYAADSGEMAASMVLSDDAMEMTDCATPCGDSDAGGSAAVCDIECGAGGFAAVLAPQTQGVFHAPRKILNPPVAQASDGLAGPPAKQPPRPLI